MDINVLDYAEALTRTLDDEELLLELLQELISMGESSIENIRNAKNAGDFEGVRSEAHKIKGAAANLSANALAKLALDLENSGKNENFENFDEIVNDYLQQFEKLKEQIKLLS